MRGIRNGASSTSSSPGRTSGGGSSIVQPGGIVGKIMQYTRYLIIVSAIFYLVPFFPHGWSYLCYKSFAVLAAGLYVVQLYTKHGFPKFSTDYLQLVLPDPYAMYLFMSAILCISKPYMSAIGPIFFLEMSNLSGDFFSYLQKNKALVDAQVKPMIDKYAPSMSHMTAEMSSPRMMQKVNFALLRNAALSQVLHGIYLIVELILPSRNLMTCVVWWQVSVKLSCFLCPLVFCVCCFGNLTLSSVYFFGGKVPTNALHGSSRYAEPAIQSFKRSIRSCASENQFCSEPSSLSQTRFSRLYNAHKDVG